MAVLDREQAMEHNLVVKATDGGGSSCQADILLMIQDMNDNPPRFSSHRYEVTVFDNTTVRTPLAVLYAKDTDTGETKTLTGHMMQVLSHRLQWCLEMGVYCYIFK